jgi:hypothetical protein
MMRMSLVLCAAVLAAGCATEGAVIAGAGATPAFTSKFGDAVRQARALQTLNPEAGRSGDPVTGIDGRAGAAAIEVYQESFRTPPQTFDTNIGGGTR